MSEGTADRARVKLVSAYDGGALFVAAFDNGLIEIRDCYQEDPTAVRGSVTVLPQHAALLAEALREAQAIKAVTGSGGVAAGTALRPHAGKATGTSLDATREADD